MGDPYGSGGGFSDYDQNRDDDEPHTADDETTMEDEETFVDDGLLDEVFNEVPGMEEEKMEGKQKPSSRKTTTRGPANQCPSCRRPGSGFYYCVMGGSNAVGPVSQVTLLNTGGYAIPQQPLIAGFPPSMTQGSGQTFSTFTGKQLMTCTPGYTVYTGVRSVSAFVPYIVQRYVPGTCNTYDVQSRNWQSTGGRMTTVRQGGSTSLVGSYLVAMGGVNQAGVPVNTIEVFDTRRASLGWKPAPRWDMANPTKDHCTVMTRDARRRPELLVIGGEGSEGRVMKLRLSTGQWFSLPGLKVPRRKHACEKVNMNGRPGVVVSGGTDQFSGNQTAAVEFYDLNAGTWTLLPAMSRGRQDHMMTTVDGRLAVMAGVATDQRGETEHLNDVEVFEGSRWKPTSYGLGSARRGANLVKIPFTTFRRG